MSAKMMNLEAGEPRVRFVSRVYHLRHWRSPEWFFVAHGPALCQCLGMTEDVSNDNQL